MRTISALVACVAVAAPALAQDGVTVEAGTGLGITRTYTGDGNFTTSVGIPGGGSLFGVSTFYVSIFPVPNLMLEPQLNVTTVSSDGNTSWVYTIIGQIGYLASPEHPSSPYLAAQGGAFHRATGPASGAIGVSAGYRWRIGRGGALRFEVRYRHWTEALESEQYSFTLGVGGILAR